MIIPILELIVTALVALFLTTGIIALSLLVFCGKHQNMCRSVIILSEKDTNAELIIRACLRIDRLLGRTLPPILIDTGMTVHTREIVSLLAQKHELVVVSGKMSMFIDTNCESRKNTE